MMTPIAVPPRSSGMPSMARKAAAFWPLLNLYSGSAKTVGYVDGAAFRQNAAGKGAVARLDGHRQHEIDERLRKMVVG